MGTSNPSWLILETVVTVKNGKQQSIFGANIPTQIWAEGTEDVFYMALNDCKSCKRDEYDVPDLCLRKCSLTSFFSESCLSIQKITNHLLIMKTLTHTHCVIQFAPQVQLAKAASGKLTISKSPRKYVQWRKISFEGLLNKIIRTYTCSFKLHNQLAG